MTPSESAIQRALRLHRAGEVWRAAQVYQQILKDTPDDVNALHLVGMARHEQGRHREALPFVQRAIARKPRVAALHNSLGVVQLATGEYAKAKAALQQAIALAPSAEAFCNLGMALQNLGELDAWRSASKTDRGQSAPWRTALR